MTRPIRQHRPARRPASARMAKANLPTPLVPLQSRLSAIPEPDTQTYSHTARCNANTRFYRHNGMQIPSDRLRQFEGDYQPVWKDDKFAVPHFKGPFTVAAYKEKFGSETGPILYKMMLTVRGAALPGDGDSEATIPVSEVDNILSGLLFTGKISPRDLQNLAGALEDAEDYREKGKDRRVVARQALNALFLKLGIPLAYHITRFGGIEAVCMLRKIK